MDASPSSSPSPLVTELKTRARLRLNASRKGAGDAAAEDPRLRDCLNLVSREVGFAHWEHARRVLGGLAVAGDDMGSFWHAPRTTALLNEWFALYEQAEAALRRDDALFLLPYRRQFVVVEADFLHELGLDATAASWHEIGHDLVRGYGTPAWEELANQRLRAPRASFGQAHCEEHE